MTLRPGAGGALPVVVVTDTVTQGGVAIPVYGYTATPTDRPVLGGKARRVKVIGDSDLAQNGGKFQLSGAPVALPLVTDAGGQTEGGIAIAVYPVNVWP